MKKTTIICDGDSWVFGGEINDPNNPEIKDYSPENDYYRLPRIFSTHLGGLFYANVVNLSCPADDNDTILHRTMTYITSNFISKGLPTDNLFVIIGWTTPERHLFWYKEGGKLDMMILNPYLVPGYEMTRAQIKLWEQIVKYLWNPEEYIPRYVMNVINFQNFCNSNNIKWLCFNSWYGDVVGDTNFLSMDVIEELSNIKTTDTRFITSFKIENGVNDYISLWNSVDNIRYYKKDQLDNTFRSFINKSEHQDKYNNQHPSPKSHELWAKELYDYINKNDLL
jgi:hypothetical protein